MTRTIGVLLFLFCFQGARAAQDTLPQFSVVAKKNGSNVISWTNAYPYTSQISIQRSFDSTRMFKTILTVPDPRVPQNGVVDAKAPAPKMFYRLFIVLDSGKYVFSRSTRPAPDTASSTAEILETDNQRVVLSDSLDNKEIDDLKNKMKPSPVPKPKKIFIVKKRDTIVNRIDEIAVKRFRDSIVYSTRDTLVFAAVDTILIKPFVPREVYRASKYVYTEKYGNVMISLPQSGRQQYSISFFDEDKTHLFDIEEIRSTSLVVDKTNFVHAGWFWFELYENGKLKEAHKFFIPKDF